MLSKVQLYLSNTNFVREVLFDILIKNADTHDEILISKRYLANKVLVRLSKYLDISQHDLKNELWRTILKLVTSLFNHYLANPVERLVLGGKIIYLKFQAARESRTHSLQVYYLKDPLKISLLFG